MCSVENVKKIRQTNFRNFFVAVKWFHEKTSKGENVLDYQTADIFRENDLWNTTISPQMKLSVKMKKHSMWYLCGKSKNLWLQFCEKSSFFYISMWWIMVFLELTEILQRLSLKYVCNYNRTYEYVPICLVCREIQKHSYKI